MSSPETSTITFKSNIYPVVAEQILYDEAFLHVLRDPYAISEFSRKATRYYPTSFQKKIKERGVGVKCTNSLERDFCWGTVLQNGEEQVVCKCENYSCSLFPECRPGVEIPIALGVLPDEEADEIDYTARPAVIEMPEEILQEPLFCTGEVSLEQTCVEVESLVEQPYTEEEVPQEKVCDEEYGLLEQVCYETAETSSEEISATEEAFALEQNNSKGEILKPAAKQSMFSNGIEGRYDECQAAIVRAHPSSRLYVNAGPGTGKTHSLIEKLKYMLEDEQVEPDRITVLSFTRAAVAVIQDRLKTAAEKGEIHAVWQDIDVTTFDKLCTRLLFFDADGDEKKEKKISGCDYDNRIMQARFLVNQKPELLSGCEHLIVDETQDLVGVRADFVLTLLKYLPEYCGFTLFGDRCQAIYDYQVKEKGTTSEEFYERVIDDFNPEQVFLEKNYRQKKSYPLDLAALRGALLDNDLDCATKQICANISLLKIPEDPMRKLDKSSIDNVLKTGSLGILTRTNEEALGVESVLWKKGISSVQKRSDANDALSRCIADAFIASKETTISKEEFESLSAAHDPYRDGRVWKGLLKVEGVHLNGDRIRKEDVLSALYLTNRTLSPELSAERENTCALVVSTIHAAKGKEFDSVWMLAEDLEQFEKSEELEEKKVVYVGLSRAATNLELQCLDEHFLKGGKVSDKTHKMYNRDRFFKRHSGKRTGAKPRLTNIEIRNVIDVDFSSFRYCRKAQEMFQKGGIEGAPLRLVLRGSGQNAFYEIVLEDEESFALGKMTRTFVDDCRACIDYRNRDAVNLPDAWDEIYIDRVVTCVGRSVSEITYDCSFGEFAVWHGITIGGYAHRDDSQGY